MSVNWRQELWPLIGSIGFGAFILGIFVIVSMFVSDIDRYQSWAFLTGLLFFGFVISLCTFFAVLLYGVPIYFVFRRFGCNGIHYYLLAGLLPAVPVLAASYPEYYVAGRLIVFGAVTAIATWAARFGFFGRHA